MQREVKISIIVPIYNVEKYLVFCIDSILNQEFSDYEIICIEDCSTDNSYNVLCDRYKNNNHIKIIQQDMNRGLSAARNKGLGIARGKYIMFVDSDDMLVPGALKLLYNTAESMSTDVVFFDYQKIYDGQEYSLDSVENSNKEYIMTGRKYFCEQVKKNNVVMEVWRQFYKSEFLKENKLEFMTGIVHEDNLFSFYVAFCAERVVHIENKLYLYRQREDSIMHVWNLKRAQSLFVIILEIFTYWTTHKYSEEESKCIAKYLQKVYMNYQILRAVNSDFEPLPFGTEQEKSLYDILYNHTEGTFLDLKKLDVKELSNAGNVIVYGAGKAAYQVIQHIIAEGGFVSRVMVENKKVNPSTFCDCVVNSIDECLDVQKNSVVIIGITAKNAKGVRQKLNNMGFNNIIELEDRVNRQ